MEKTETLEGSEKDWERDVQQITQKIQSEVSPGD